MNVYVLGPKSFVMDTIKTLEKNNMEFGPIGETQLVCRFLENEQQFKQYKENEEKIKKIFPQAKILLFGPYANKHPWQVLFETDATFVCIGDDDETTILELCKNFDNPLTYDSILGLGSKKTMVHPKTGRMVTSIFLGNKRMPRKPKD